MDFLNLQQTPLLVLSNLLIIILIYSLMKPAMCYPFKVGENRRKITQLLIIIFCIFSFWGADWFHYIYEYNMLRDMGDFKTNLEDVYMYIARYSPSYLVFRLIIWGGALLLLNSTYKRVGVGYDLTLFLFGSIWVIWFGYARVSLSMAIMFFGLAYLYESSNKNKVISVIVGAAAIVASFYFHKSSIFGIFVIVIAVFSKRLSRNTLALVVVLFPILVYIMNTQMGGFMSTDIDTESGSEIAAYVSKGQNYMERESKIRGIGGPLIEISERFVYYFIAFLCYKFQKSVFMESTPKVILVFMRVLFFNVLLASVFMFDLGANTTLLYTRLMRYSFIPASIVLSYMHQVHFTPIWTNRIIKFAFLSSVYAIIYITYTLIVNS